MNELHNLRNSEKERCQCAVFYGMSRLLLRFGAVCASEQAFGRGNVGRYRAPSWESWPGESVGVRAPAVGETPLSVAEVAYLFRGCAI